MEKSEFTKDYLVSRLITMNKEVNGYGRIYYQANENLVDSFDFNKKGQTYTYTKK